MNGDMLFMFGLLLVTIILFVSDRVRLDVVAVLVILVLTTGIAYMLIVGRRLLTDRVAGYRPFARGA